MIMKKISYIFIIVVMLIAGFSSKTQAAFIIEKAELYSKGEYVDLLFYNGVEVLTTFVVYQKDGIEYPAYCIQREKPGVTETIPYTVTVEGGIQNSLVWKAIINGFPYKTPEELGCANEIEAFVATKQAVYCMLYDNDAGNFERYEAIGEAGQRTLNALKQIVTVARNSTQVKPTANVTITAQDNQWRLENNTGYVYRTFKAEAGGNIKSYQLTLQGEVPEGTLLTNQKNEEKQTFSGGEIFKIRIPLKSLTKSGSFEIKSTAEVITTPVLYGKSQDVSFQDYALTGSRIELGENITEIDYHYNNTTIIVLKKDKITGEPIKNTQFRLLDENKVELYHELTTDEQGKITIPFLTPGTYYLEETSSSSGYELYQGLIQLEVDYNEEYTVIVNNQKGDKTEVETKTKTMEISQEKLPKAGM